MAYRTKTKMFSPCVRCGIKFERKTRFSRICLKCGDEARNPKNWNRKQKV